MSYPNVNTLWAETLVEELVAGGVEAVCVSPGSRSTPLTVACAEHTDLRVYSHLDERSSAFFALGRAKRTGEPTPLVCTSGTAAANFHPAVIEASQSGVPMLVLTADRPPELTDSGANQTIDQEKLYGDAVRWYRDMPEPAAEPRKVRMLRTTVARALANSTGSDPGPVHLNCRFRKPLEPTPVPDDHPEGVPENWAGGDPLAAEGRDGPFVTTAQGAGRLDDADLSRVVSPVEAADRGLVVAGPADGGLGSDALGALADATGFPVLADPLSNLRSGSHVADHPVLGGYDAYLGTDAVADWPDPDVVLRFGASPTSKPLRQYLRDADCRQFVVAPSGRWTEATFTASDLLVADPDETARDIAERVAEPGDPAWADRFRRADQTHWDTVTDALDGAYWEGGVLADVTRLAPDPATLFVSNSMPVRDLDRFGEPRTADHTVLGNRGASGIDGITSTALGAGSATEDPLVLVTGDLAYYHDMNGLLALARCGVDATIVLVDNDGGGIFHMLPIEDHETFESQFKTPHGLDFEPTGELYGLAFERLESREAFVDAFERSAGSGGTQVLSVAFDAADSHARRDALQDRLVDAF
ncbi:2-succinyl-5-enolpyruvyl-6-hydroxy-3-cyclohexene-1-carboxylic-acid synthase [Haloarcula salinisoli]|uniref:2-succinyl-5-enolpyruvyl-6-hydroxy-3-cyclohexene-1-carboxylate synthase n=1 Tax=Haloarcula salinisoli TaxID=2487746 RepID=A0A8J8C8J2_9EURY|nr:2-succinyl-5-enolpyruvyl-6-hydroxy-3-cyclohexene-1-carboxylic-acid synthase [Halomicroarcula salinisoli]MBX0285327.1 2-succinyl-5-enolpyruvyl-6-hydroxy-3-cyclohexene-1-carboxylic-acid synthase [Halomicroarcula salinisoli]MBX0303194.1 2-succinyl-5-enolpyruvyl-6-hydroxy-3-cyclohexene-1-carboxylic-acid synthase [Halomicroarcula salinisoli]